MAAVESIKRTLETKHLMTGGTKEDLEKRLAMWHNNDTDKALADLSMTDDMVDSIERTYLRSVAARLGVLAPKSRKNQMQEIVKEWLRLARRLKELGVRPEGKVEDLKAALKLWSNRTPKQAIADRTITAEEAVSLDSATLAGALRDLGVDTTGDVSPRLLATQLMKILNPSEKRSQDEKPKGKTAAPKKEKNHKSASNGAGEAKKEDDDVEHDQPKDTTISENPKLGFCIKKPSQPLVETLRKHYINHRRQGNATYYIYMLLDPRMYDPNLCLKGFLSAVFYVGKGHGARVDSYYKASSNKGDGEFTSPKLRHIRETWYTDSGYVSIKLFQNSPEDMAFDLEHAMIHGMTHLAGKHLWNKGPNEHRCWHDPVKNSKCLTNRKRGSPKSGVKSLTPDDILNLSLEVFQHAYTIAIAENSVEECILYPNPDWKEKMNIRVATSVILKKLT